MLDSATACFVLAVFNLDGSEIILILALVLIMFGAKKFPDVGKGLGQGLFRFWKAPDDQAHDAGASLGGIYGKPAAQALTPENDVSELYNPAVFRKPEMDRHSLFRDSLRLWKQLWRRVFGLFRINK